jgi:hypothetical protein
LGGENGHKGEDSKKESCYQKEETERGIYEASADQR